VAATAKAVSVPKRSKRSANFTTPPKFFKQYF
jgi:hypothetical protein